MIPLNELFANFSFGYFFDDEIFTLCVKITQKRKDSLVSKEMYQGLYEKKKIEYQEINNPSQRESDQTESYRCC